jgi:hypothetical protein
MPVTLAQARLNAQDDIQAGVIDEFRKSSFLLDNMVFDDAVSPGTAGGTLTYGYTRVVTQPTAAFRAINSEYAAQEATKQRYTVDLKIFGGKFDIDRVVASINGLIDEVQFQLQQKVKATRALFHDTFINGDSAVDANAFDGIDKAVTGTSTEYNTSTAIDLSSSTAMDSNYKAMLDKLDEFLSLLDERPSALMGNARLISRLRSVARRSGYFSQTEDAFGRTVDAYDGIPLIDLGEKPGSTSPIVAIDPTTGETALYAVRLGLDACHGVSLTGQPLVRTWLPDFSTPGAVKSGEVEMVAAIALKRTKAAGVFRKIKVQ